MILNFTVCWVSQGPEGHHEQGTLREPWVSLSSPSMYLFVVLFYWMYLLFLDDFFVKKVCLQTLTNKNIKLFTKEYRNYKQIQKTLKSINKYISFRCAEYPMALRGTTNKVPSRNPELSLGSPSTTGAGCNMTNNWKLKQTHVFTCFC